MRARVFVLRDRGRRRPERSGDGGIAGELQNHTMTRGSESHRVVQLFALQTLSSRPGELVPALFELELIALGATAFLLRGYESVEGVGYAQEWRCDIV